MLLIIAAVALETRQLRRRMRPVADSDQQLFRGTTAAGRQTRLLLTGIGPTSTAINLTRFLERETPQAVVMIGCGGSYPNSGLRVGDLALATEEIFGDLGVMTDQRFLPLDQLEIPLTPPPVQRISLENDLMQAVAALLRTALADQPNRLRCGPLVTVSTCSGQPRLSRELEARTGGICENMEGAAAAQACALYRLPFLELRGISNPTGTRDPEQWDLPRGAGAAQWGLDRILDHWPQLEKTLCRS